MIGVVGGHSFAFRLSGGASQIVCQMLGEMSCILTVSMLQFAASFDLNDIGYVGGESPLGEYRQKRWD